MLNQYYLSITAFVAGLFVIFSMKKVTGGNSRGHPGLALWNFIFSILPVLVIIILIIATNIDPSIIVIGVTVLYFILQKMTFKEKAVIVKRSFAWDSILLIAGVMIFKDFLAESRALNQFIESIPKSGNAEFLLLILFPMLIGFLTGVNQAYVGVVLPVVLPFILAGGNPDYLKIAVFYASGFTGVLLSPVHLCLSLTKTYFKADFIKVYRYLIPSTLPILIIPIILLLLRGK